MLIIRLATELVAASPKHGWSRWLLTVKVLNTHNVHLIQQHREQQLHREELMTSSYLH